MDLHFQLSHVRMFGFAKWCFLLLVCYLCCVPQFTHAASVQLWVNGEESANVVSGEDVTLTWQLSGVAGGCEITRAGVPVHSFNDPSSVGPFIDRNVQLTGSANYQLTCGSLSGISVVRLLPVVELTLPGGTEQAYDPNTGYLRPSIEWDTEYASECGDISFEYRDRSGGFTLWEDEYVQDSYHRMEGAARVSHLRNLNESGTFYIECFNDGGGGTRASVALTVSDPGVPPPVEVNAWASAATVVADPVFGYAYVDAGFTSENASNCSFKSYDADGTVQNEVPWPWGNGWGAPVINKPQPGWRNIQLATSTELEVTCTRPSYTVNDQFYAASSDTDSVLITVAYPDGAVIGDDGTWDRSTVSPVEVVFEVDPPTTEKDQTGYATTSARVMVTNADYCEFKSYKVSNGEAVVIWIPGGLNWTRNPPSHARQPVSDGYYHQDVTIRYNESVRLVADCYREYDRLYGDAAERENGMELVERVWTINEYAGEYPEPTAQVYVNPIRFTTEYIRDNHTQMVNYQAFGGTPANTEMITMYGILPNTTAATARVSFPFAHPEGVAGEAAYYDIILKHCDESDGVSTFTVYADGATVGSLQTDDVLNSSATCLGAYDDNPAFSSIELRKIGSAELRHGDLLTVECNRTSGSGEYCSFTEVIVAPAHSGTVPVAPADPDSSLVQLDLTVVGENVTECSGLPATTAGGGSYGWYPGSWPANRFVSVDVFASTTFPVECTRASDGATVRAEVEAAYPEAGEVVTDEVTLNFGACYLGATPLTEAQAIEAGYMPGPDGITCVPYLDLYVNDVSNSGISSAIPDPVNGMYDNIQVILSVGNHEQPGGDLPEDSTISYLVRLDPQDEWLLTDIYSTLGEFDEALAAGAVPVNITPKPVLNGVPFGKHDLYGRFNLDSPDANRDGNPDNFPEHDLSDNEFVANGVFIPIPEPPMTLTTDGTADQKLIRSGVMLPLEWTIDVRYEMECQILGPGVTTLPFTVSGSGLHSGTETVGPIENASEFVFSCTEERVTGGLGDWPANYPRTFIERLLIEVVPAYEET